MGSKKSIAIVGGGASALMLACMLDHTKFTITIYEKNAAPGRKLLVAGKGGFNLTHSEELGQFADRYTPKTFIEPFLKQFSNTDFRNWLRSIGIETYVGTSKRVFPVKGIKPIEVLNAIEKKLQQNKVHTVYKHEWKGWKNKELIFQTSNGQTINMTADSVVFALGGGSWKVTGSDGLWLNYFGEKEISTEPFYPSNCAYELKWNSEFIKQHAGQALKNCEFTCGNSRKKGEAVLTAFGIEGSGIYPLSPAIRQELLQNNKAQLFVDLKPDLSETDIKQRLENKGSSSMKELLEKKLHLSKTHIDLIKSLTTKEEYHHPERILKLIKSLPLTITAAAPLDDAISTVGGISVHELNSNLEFKKLPGHFCMGEMINWDAPTGGYLLQACFSMGFSLAKTLNNA